MKARQAAAGLALCGAVGLAVLAWPRMIGGAVIAPFEDTLRGIARTRTVNAVEIREAREGAHVSLGWFDYGRTWKALGGFELVAARVARTPEDQRAALAHSVDALRDGLAQAPGDAYAWLQLAQADRALNGVRPTLNGPLRMSLNAAPYEHRLAIPRIEIAFRAWEFLEPDVRKAMAVQIKRAVDTAPVQLARSTRRHFALRFVRQSLADSPIHLQRFNIVYLNPD